MMSSADPVRAWRRARRRARLARLVGAGLVVAAVVWSWPERPAPVYRILYLPTPAKLRQARAAAPAELGAVDTGDTGEGWTLGEQREIVIDEVNAVRAEGARCGRRWLSPVGPLRRDRFLEEAAQAQARWIADEGEYAHKTPGNPAGEDPAARAWRAGYGGETVGENLAWGQVEPEAAVDWWLGSPVHCRLLMADDVFELGVGVEADPETPRGWIWVLAVGG